MSCPHPSSLSFASSATLPCAGCLFETCFPPVAPSASTTTATAMSSNSVDMAKHNPWAPHLHQQPAALLVAGLQDLARAVDAWAASLSPPPPEQVELATLLGPRVCAMLQHDQVPQVATQALLDICAGSLNLLRERGGPVGARAATWWATSAVEGFTGSRASMALATLTLGAAPRELHVRLVATLCQVLAAAPSPEAWGLGLAVTCPNHDALALEFARALPPHAIEAGLVAQSVPAAMCASQVWLAPVPSAVDVSKQTLQSLVGMLLGSVQEGRHAACLCLAALAAHAAPHVLATLLGMELPALLTGSLSEFPADAMQCMASLCTRVPPGDLCGRLVGCVQPCLDFALHAAATVGAKEQHRAAASRALHVVGLAAQTGDMNVAQACRVLGSLQAAAIGALPGPALADALGMVAAFSHDDGVLELAGALLLRMTQTLAPCHDPDQDTVRTLLASCARVADSVPKWCVDCVEQGALRLAEQCLARDLGLRLLWRTLEAASCRAELRGRARDLAVRLRRSGLALAICANADADAARALRALCACQALVAWDSDPAEFQGRGLEDFADQAASAGSLTALAVLACVHLDPPARSLDLRQVCEQAAAKLASRGQLSDVHATLIALCLHHQASAQPGSLSQVLACSLREALCAEHWARVVGEACEEQRSKAAVLRFLVGDNLVALSPDLVHTLLQSWGPDSALGGLLLAEPRLLEHTKWTAATCQALASHVPGAPPHLARVALQTLLDTGLGDPARVCKAMLDLALGLAQQTRADGAAPVAVKFLRLPLEPVDLGVLPPGLKVRAALARVGLFDNVAHARLWFDAHSIRAAVQAAECEFVIQALRAQVISLHHDGGGEEVRACIVNELARHLDLEVRAECAEELLAWLQSASEAHDLWRATVQAERARVALTYLLESAGSLPARLTASKCLGAMTPQVSPWTLRMFARLGSARTFSDVALVHCLCMLAGSAQQQQDWLEQMFAAGVQALDACVSESKWSQLHQAIVVCLAVLSKRVPCPDPSLPRVLRSALQAAMLHAPRASPDLLSEFPGSDAAFQFENGLHAGSTCTPGWIRACGELLVCEGGALAVKALEWMLAAHC
jgi:hypothetical protein